MLHAWKRACYKADTHIERGANMKRFWVPLCFILGFAMLAFSLYFWGGTASTAEVGALVRERAASFSFLTWAYVSAGYEVLNSLGWQEGASQFASDQVGQVFVSMQANPVLALDELFNAQPWYVRISYYAGPLMILLGAFAQARKPKTFKTFG